MTFFSKSVCFLSVLFGTLISISDARGRPYGVHSNENYTEFHCNFKNPEYEMSGLLARVPIWGPRYCPSTDVVRTDLLLSHLQVIKSVLQNVVKTKNYNNYELFKQFYLEYQRLHTTSNFEKIIQVYRPKFMPGQTYDAQSIAALHDIKTELGAKLPSIGNSMFLCASIENPSDNLVQNANYPSNRPPSQNYFNHVLGVIKFSIFSTKVRFGYILLQPGDGIVNPIIVMEDGEAPHGEFGPYGKTHLKYSVLPRNKNFIVAKSADSSYAFWIFVGRPYCSFLDTTSHYELFSTYKKVFKRNEEGTIEGGFYFSVVPETQRIVFLLNKIKYPIRIEKKNDTEGYNLIANKKENEVINRVESLLGENMKRLRDEIQIIGDILHNTEFLANLKQQSPFTSESEEPVGSDWTTFDPNVISSSDEKDDDVRPERPQQSGSESSHNEWFMWTLWRQLIEWIQRL